MNRRFRTPHLACAAAALAVISALPALAADIAATGEKHVKTIMDRPLQDLNVMQPAVAAALRNAARAPYALPDPSCETITMEIQQLEAALGPDFDRRSATSNRTLPTVAQLEGEAAGSFIPYEGALRFITGADKHDRKLAEMVLAGAVRRAYLKGTGEARGCATAAPIRVRSTAN
jgi:hypothetical protein